MFLYLLNEKLRILFQKLAIKAAEANDIVDVREKNLLKAFALEMNIEPLYETDSSLEVLFDDLKKHSTKKELKIILLELLGMMYADRSYDEKEHSFMAKVATNFGESEAFLVRLESILLEYKELCRKIGDLILS